MMQRIAMSKYTVAAGLSVGQESLRIEVILMAVRHEISVHAHEVRGRQKPLRQGIFAHLGASRAQQLVQTASAEQIQVGCIDVVLDVELLAGGPAAAPVIFQAPESRAVKLHSPLGARSQAAYALVVENQGDESSRRDEQPRR